MKNLLITLLVLAAIALGLLYYFRDSVPFLNQVEERAEAMMPGMNRGDVQDMEAEETVEMEAQGG